MDESGTSQNDGTKGGGRHGRGRGRKPYDKRKVQCYMCDKFGHYSYECWHNSSSKKNKKGDEAHLAQDESDSESDHVLLMVTIISGEDESCWYLDMGCSNHMTERREWLIDLDPSVRSSVKFADNSTITTEGVGKVMITQKDGKTAYMSDLLYVLNMKNNLLSLGQLLEKGYTVSMQQNHIEVYDGQ